MSDFRKLRSRALLLQAVLLAASLCLTGCDFLPAPSTVGDVVSPDDGAGQPVAGAGFFDATVVNESSTQADVTLRFLLVETIVHETVLRRVAPGTSTNVAGPELATRLVATGIDDTGRTLPEETFLHEGAADERTLARYVIGDPPPPDPPDNPPDDVDTNGEPPDVDTSGPPDVDTTGEPEPPPGGGGGGGPTPIVDCNTNGIADASDIAAGTSKDIDEDGMPDECEPDCNENNLPDDYDIASGEYADCNENTILDECELAGGTATDCNESGVLDECDIAAGSSADANENGLPDECDPDCNKNGLPDDLDIAAGTSEDCNTNAVPDECETDPCPLPEACCVDASCVDLTAEDCLAIGGLPGGPETACENYECPEACCLPDGTCADVAPSVCVLDQRGILAAGGEPQGPGSTCEEAVCPQPGACCDTNGACSVVQEEVCPGMFQGEGSACSEGICLTACCYPDGSCWESSVSDCLVENGEPLGIGTSCLADICPVLTEACCAFDSDCMDLLPEDCLSIEGEPLGPGSSCELDECPQACCHADGTCTDAMPTECLLDGLPQGVGTACAFSDGCPIDCQLNGIPDIEELAENDCNENRVPDECDIAAGTSEDVNTNNLPDECELRSLEGWWLAEFVSSNALQPQIPFCDFWEVFAREYRYLRFGEDNQLMESWAPMSSRERYVVFTYPSTNGPSFVEVYYLGSSDFVTSRSATVSVLEIAGGTVEIQETVYTPDSMGESGMSLIGMSLDLDWTRMQGEWQFISTSDNDPSLCGTVTAIRSLPPPPFP